MSSAGTSLRGHRHAVDDHLDQPRLARWSSRPPTAVPSDRLGGEGHLGFHRHFAWFLQLDLVAGRLAVDGELQGVGVAVGDVGTALGQALAPGGKVDSVDLAELHVDAALADPAAGDAGEIGLAAGLEREAAVHDVIPAIPLRDPQRVHGADEIAQPLRRR